MSRARLIALCALVLCCFAANSLLTRSGLRTGLAGAAAFMSLRLLSGAFVLFILSRSRGRDRAGAEAGWLSALALLLYAVPFSWAYLKLPAGTGAFLLFGSVQATMIAAAVLGGERPPPRTWLGLAIALGGLAALTLPGAEAPSLPAALAMIAAGVAWGWYSLRGRRAKDGIAATTDAFVRSAPFAAAVWIGAAAIFPDAARLTLSGAALAIASGALASGLGYSIWNSALPHLRASTAAVLQLCVPVLAAAGGIAILGERPTIRFAAAGAAILFGVALAVLQRR